MKKEDFEKSLKLPRILLEWSGIQIFPKRYGNTNLIKSWIHYFNMIFMCPMLLGEIWWMIEGAYMGENIEDLCTIAPCFTVCILSTAKINCLYFNRDVVGNIVEKLRVMHPDDKEDWSVKERRIVKDSMTFLRRVMIFFFYCSIFVVIVFGAVSASSMLYDFITTGTSEFKLPFRLKYFFEISSLSRWALMYLYQIWAMVVVCIQLLSADLLFYGFCTYLQMHFRLVCLRFENVVSKNNVQTKERLRKAVRRHQELIELVEQIELLYSKSTLCNVVLSSLQICLSGFIVTFIKDIGAVSTFLGFLMMNLSQISLFCYFGDMLTSASTEVSQAVYNSLWYEAQPDVKKSILIVLIRSQRPCKITAMKFAEVNLYMLSAILRTSWSYFALLKTMYD